MPTFMRGERSTGRPGGKARPSNFTGAPDPGKKEGRESQIPPESQFAPFLNQRQLLKEDPTEIPPDSEPSHEPFEANYWLGISAEATIHMGTLPNISRLGRINLSEN
jgi:hypothetical protein